MLELAYNWFPLVVLAALWVYESRKYSKEREAEWDKIMLCYFDDVAERNRLEREYAEKLQREQEERDRVQRELLAEIRKLNERAKL